MFENDKEARPVSLEQCEQEAKQEKVRSVGVTA